MSFRSTSIALFAMACSTAGADCALAQTSTEKPQAAPVRDAYQGAWSVSANAKDKSAADSASLDLFLFGETVTVLTPAEGLNQFRAQRNEALIRNQGRLPSGDRARLKKQSDALNAMHPGSFEAELAAFYSAFPSPTAYEHLDAAARQQPARDELLGPKLVRALRHDDRSELVPAARELKLRGGVAPGLFDMADDILLSVDPGAVLIVAGEMDGFPVLVRQYAEGKRPDVLVVDQRLLDDASYRARVWQRAKARGAVPPDAASFTDRLLRSSSRPVFLSLALGREWAERYATLLHVTGMAMRLSESPCCDIRKLDAAWSAMSRTTAAGPLSRNYAIPAAVLLKHHRAQGDEEKAALLEHQLRELAKRTGITRELQATGILPH